MIWVICSHTLSLSLTLSSQLSNAKIWANDSGEGERVRAAEVENAAAEAAIYLMKVRCGCLTPYNQPVRFYRPARKETFPPAALEDHASSASADLELKLL